MARDEEMTMGASGSADGRDWTPSGQDPRTRHKKVERHFPGGIRPERCGLGQIWVISPEKPKFRFERISYFSASYMKRLEPGPAGRPELPGKGYRNWPKTGRKWAYFKLLSVDPGVGLG